jgi:hypothetical protein
VELVSHKSSWSIIFMIFSLTVCHSHSYLVYGWQGGWRRWCSDLLQDWLLDLNPRGGRDYLFLVPVWTCPVAYWAMFTVRYDTLSREYSSQGMELITHPNLVLMLRTSRAVPLFLLCATISMLLSDLYLLHTCGWLFMNSVFMYRQKTRAANNKSVKTKGFIKKFASSFPNWK